MGRRHYLNSHNRGPVGFYAESHERGDVEWDESLQAWLGVGYEACRQVLRSDNDAVCHCDVDDLQTVTKVGGPSCLLGTDASDPARPVRRPDPPTATSSARKPAGAQISGSEEVPT